MPLRQTAFRLSDESLRELDEIAATLPRTPLNASKTGGNRSGGIPASRTAALIYAIALTHKQTSNAADGRQGE